MSAIDYDSEELFEYEHLDAYLAVDLLSSGVGFFIGRREDCASIIVPTDEAKVLVNRLAVELGLLGQ